MKEDVESTLPTTTDLERKVFGGEADLLKTLTESQTDDAEVHVNLASC